MHKIIKITFKCGNHSVEVEKLTDLHNVVRYGGAETLILPNGKIPKRRAYKCPVCDKNLHYEEELISQEQYNLENAKC